MPGTTFWECPTSPNFCPVSRAGRQFSNPGMCSECGAQLIPIQGLEISLRREWYRKRFRPTITETVPIKMKTTGRRTACPVATVRVFANFKSG